MNAAETLQALDQFAFVILPALLVAEQLGIALPAVPALLGFGALAAHGRGSIPLMLRRRKLNVSARTSPITSAEP